MKKRMSSALLILCLCLVSLPAAAADNFYDGLTLVWENDESLPHFGGPAGSHEGDGRRYGLVDDRGNQVTPMKYRWIEPFSEGFAQVWGDEGYGFIDRTGQEVVPPQYASARDFSGGMAAVCVCREDGEPLWGYVDRTGELAIPLQYRIADDFSEGLAAVCIYREDGALQYGYIDGLGHFVVPPQYERASLFREGLAPVRKRVGELSWKWGYIDRQGNEVIPFLYEQASCFQDGVAWVETVEKQGEDWLTTQLYIDRAGRDVTAYASTQNVLVNGSAVKFQCYALKDQNGNDTNYVKLRDVAQVLNGTSVQFQVGWDGSVNIETGKGYTANGSEMKTPFSGNRAYSPATAPTNVNGQTADLDAIVLLDDNGGAYTYYKLRDLGAALGFTVDWSAEKGIFIETR